MTPGTIKGAQKLLRGLQQEAQNCSFSEVHFFQLFLDLCEDSRDHISGPNTKCHTILESLRQCQSSLLNTLVTKRHGFPAQNYLISEQTNNPYLQDVL